MEKTKSHSRLYYITFLQVIGPILVIVGHMLNGMPYNFIMQNIKNFIYVFHMPLFFFISGYLFSYKKGLENKKYREFIKGKALRLLLPYFVFNILFFIPKIFASGFIVDQVELSFNYILYILITPRMNVLGHLWFLFALFLIYAIAPIWNFIIKKDKKIIWTIVLIVFILLNLFSFKTDVLAIRDLCKDTLFFVLGMIIAKLGKEKLENICTKRNFIFAFVIYVITFILWLIFNNNITSMLLCTTDIIMLLIIPIVFKISNKIFDELGSYSFSIYIMHWPVMLFIRIALYQILNLNPILVSILMILGGYFMPLLIIKIWKKIKDKGKIDSKILYYLIGI